MNQNDDVTKDSQRAPQLAPEGMNINPVCPYCGMDPVAFGNGTVSCGPVLVWFAFCKNLHCRRLLSLAPLGMQEQRVQPASRIVVPN